MGGLRSPIATEQHWGNRLGTTIPAFDPAKATLPPSHINPGRSRLGCGKAGADRRIGPHVEAGFCFWRRWYSKTGEDPRKPSPLVGESWGGGLAHADCHETKLDGADGAAIPIFSRATPSRGSVCLAKARIIPPSRKSIQSSLALNVHQNSPGQRDSTRGIRIGSPGMPGVPIDIVFGLIRLDGSGARRLPRMSVAGKGIRVVV